MPKYEESRWLPHSAQKLFSVVADVEKYPEFLPWALSSQIIERTEDSFLSDLTIGYKRLQETYRSKVHLQPHSHIQVEYIHGPFKYLESWWKFDDTHKAGRKGCIVEFFIDFEFQSVFLSALMKPIFNYGLERIITGFESRVTSS